MVDFSRATEQIPQPPVKRHRVFIVAIDGGYFWAVAQHVSGGEYKQSRRFPDFASAKADLDYQRKDGKFPLSFL